MSASSREPSGRSSGPDGTVTLRLTVNGEDREATVEARTTLVFLLREAFGLTGTHIGCLTGHCGTCTVLLNGAAVKSCTVLAASADGDVVTTIEGLAREGRLHPVQQAFWDEHGFQCGYCTPGMILTTLTLLADHPTPTDDEIKRGLSGNLCRCTGYQHIITAVHAAAAALRRERDVGSRDGC